MTGDLAEQGNGLIKGRSSPYDDSGTPPQRILEMKQ
jgi:hypothetical protein